jgi:tRNA threonylcarbamoyladenosine biosynthesis protein TsaE
VNQLRVHNAAQMQEFGERVAAVVQGTDVLILTGGLGAGKTTFSQGVARGLGITEPVTSPTFVLAKNYSGQPWGLVHLDVYRISSADELLDLWSESDAQHALTLVEWGEPWRTEFGSSVVELVFSEPSSEDVDIREIELINHSPNSDLAQRIAGAM